MLLASCRLPLEFLSDLAVSFHSVAPPCLKESSSSSVKRSWGTCSRSSSSVPRMNWTRWDGVSAQRRNMDAYVHGSVAWGEENQSQRGIAAKQERENKKDDDSHMLKTRDDIRVSFES
ncbi:hypothetical protein EYF80_029816 [Liparis tanakae]|uniref:Uncharacterized protein n=1 Tax=Liparis tanakae TaxID=230148 RepID=A0A4Z2H568_9TELE|nr:hypothetical protein EYF80_029816 [Liparis tanakae]